MKFTSIFVLEDDIITIKLIQNIFEKYQFTPLVASDAYSSEEIIMHKEFSAAILDLSLPDINGIEVLQTLRTHPLHSSIPIIILTSNDDKTETVISLEMGADDYITKPFHGRELIARLKAHLRRRTNLPSKSMIYGELVITAAQRQVFLNDNPIHITYNEFELLFFMASNPGIVMSRDSLLNKIWGNDFVAESRTVDIHISSLRKKLGSKSGKQYIETVRGIGYRFIK